MPHSFHFQIQKEREGAFEEEKGEATDKGRNREKQAFGKNKVLMIEHSNKQMAATIITIIYGLWGDFPYILTILCHKTCAEK